MFISQHDKSLAVYLLRYLLITILKLGVNELDQAVSGVTVYYNLTVKKYHFHLQIHKEIMVVLNHCAQERDMWQEQTGEQHLVYRISSISTHPSNRTRLE